MPSDTKGAAPDSKTAHEKVLAEIADAKRRAEPEAAETEKSSSETDATGPRSAALHAAKAYWSRIAADDRRRWRASLALAIAINAVLLTALGVFGRVRIFVPNAPSDSISVVFVDLPEDPIFPELRDPETVPEPEPEDADVVEQPELEPEPEPEPTPEPEEALQEEEAPDPEPDEPEPEPDPEPAIDLTPDTVFAPPAEEVGPFVPETEPATVRETAPGAPDAGDAAEEAADDEQSPAEDDAPLVEEEARETGVEFAEEDAADEDGELVAGEDVNSLAPPVEIGDDDEITGDDAFDNQSRFIKPRVALPLPNVDLPEGETPALPGESGVVAIFCPEEFQNEDKQQECAGRTEIRSGWRPGSSGEDWSEATRLLKQQRREGGVANGPAPAQVVPPAVARRLEDERRARELSDFRRSAEDVNDLSRSGDTLDDTFVRPDIGPPGVEPSGPSATTRSSIRAILKTSKRRCARLKKRRTSRRGAARWLTTFRFVPDAALR